MAKQLSVKLPPNWMDYSKENPDGPPTYVRTGEENVGVLQISLFAKYESGEVPQPKAIDLVKLASDHGAKSNLGKITRTLSGECVMGLFGSAIFQSTDKTRIQIWYLSNKYDFVLATHICSHGVNPLEYDEAQQIVSKVNYCEESTIINKKILRS